MRTLFERLLSGGYASADEELVTARAEEGLYLEFKTLADHASATLTKEDRKLLVKAACGMANADGGTILIGVRTSKVDGVDVATSLQVLVKPDAIRNRVLSLMGEGLSPPHRHIEVAAIKGEDGAGLVAVHVPPSEQGPHMAVTEHRYFRRGSDGTRMMDHREIRDAMSAERAGKLEVRFQVSGGAIYGGVRIKGSIQTVLVNVGAVPVWAPYLIVDSSEAVDGAEGFTIRRKPDGGGVGYYSARDMMIPPGDEVALAKVPVGIVVHDQVPKSAESALQMLATRPELVVFSDVASCYATDAGVRVQERFHHFSVRYGGSNAQQESRQMDLDRKVILRRLLELRASA